MRGDDEPVAFDGGSPRTRKQILFQLNDRLKSEPGVAHTRFEPSRITPDTIVAAVEPTVFLGEQYPAENATLTVWWAPRHASRDQFRIQWYEAADSRPDQRRRTSPTQSGEYTLSCGWHQDATHDDLGPAHFQEEYPDGTSERYGVTFKDATPRWILSRCLQKLPARLATFRDRLESGAPDD